MGLDKFLIGFPLAIMIFAIFLASSSASALQVGGKQVQFCSEGVNCAGGNNVQTFTFGSVTTTSFIDMLVISVGVAALAGLSIFGSGESPEAVHIIFMFSLIIGVWSILSLAEGFVNPNGPSPASVFSSLNKGISGLGTSVYLLLTIVYMIG